MGEVKRFYATSVVPKKNVPAIETFLKYISIIVIERRGTTVVVLSFCGGFLAKLVELYKFVPLC